MCMELLIQGLNMYDTDIHITTIELTHTHAHTNADTDTHLLSMMPTISNMINSNKVQDSENVTENTNCTITLRTYGDM